MPLRISLKPFERVLINGAVIENGETRASITLQNDVCVLRERDILTERDATTPARRLYLAVLMMYIEPAKLGVYQAIYDQLAGELLSAAPSMAARIHEASAHLSQARYYQALKVLQGLIEYEAELMGNACQSSGCL